MRRFRKLPALLLAAVLPVLSACVVTRMYHDQYGLETANPGIFNRDRAACLERAYKPFLSRMLRRGITSICISRLLRLPAPLPIGNMSGECANMKKDRISLWMLFPAMRRRGIPYIAPVWEKRAGMKFRWSNEGNEKLPF